MYKNQPADSEEHRERIHLLPFAWWNIWFDVGHYCLLIDLFVEKGFNPFGIIFGFNGKDEGLQKKTRDVFMSIWVTYSSLIKGFVQFVLEPVI